MGVVAPKAMVFLLLTGALLVVSPISSAQDDDGEPREEPITLEPISVTGYQIKRTDTEGPAPVDIYERAEIEATGYLRLGDFFRYLPQSVGQISESNNTNQTAGAATINLRGIGIDNTLVLVNGKRVAGYARNGIAEAFVDVNAIPVAAIERVEILRDGASAIYGADAVAGVVNIILRSSFDGFQLGGGYLSTLEGDGEEWHVDGVWGWRGERTEVLATLSYTDKRPILARDRELTADVDYSDLGGPNFRSFNGTPTTYSPTPLTSIPDPECGINPDIADVTTFFFGPVGLDVCLFNYNYFAQLTYDYEVLGGNFNVRHSFTDQLRGRLEIFASRRDTITELAPPPVLFRSVRADHPNNFLGVDVGIAARPLDVGNRRLQTDADTYRLVAGLEGDWNGWELTGDLLFSGTDVSTLWPNAVVIQRFQDALFGQGGPNGDLYYNPFGANPQNPGELLDWMTVATRTGADTTENALELQASKFFGRLPGGPVGLAVGLQYREQELDEFIDEFQQQGGLAGGGRGTAIDASRDIFVAYSELSLPLLESLEAQLALRYDDYSDFGSTTNPKVALAWRPTRDWLLRASYGTSFRPPSFPELFNPAVEGTTFLRDSVRCEGTGAPEDCAFSEYPIAFLGNPELQPEEGESVLVGVVWSPSFLEGFDIEVDYWRFVHEERIVQLSPQTILDVGSDFGITRGPQTPEDVALGVPGRIESVIQTFANSDELETSGWDVLSTYSWDTERLGDWRLALNYTYVATYRLNIANAGSAEAGVDFAGRYFNFQFGIPEHRGNLTLNWQLGAHSFAGTARYIGSFEGAYGLEENGIPTGEPWIVDDWLGFDLQYAVQFSNQRTLLRLGCQNCFDEDPPQSFRPNGEGLYDYRGAIVYTRLEHRFD